MTLPSGRVTLMLAEIVGGACLWDRGTGAMQVASTRYFALLRERTEAAGGHLVPSVGEAHCAVFIDPLAAIAAAVALQGALGSRDRFSSFRIGHGINSGHRFRIS